MKPVIGSCRIFYFNRIVGSMVDVLSGVLLKNLIEIFCGLLDSGVSGNVESGGGGKIELEVKGQVCYETFRSFCKQVKDEVNEVVGYIIG